MSRKTYSRRIARNEQVIEAFGEVLRELREKEGLSQEKLGLECGMDRTYISLLERKKRQPSISSIFALSERLGIKASKLISLVEKYAK